MADVTLKVANFRGALVKKSADQTAANYSGNAAVPFDAEEYDTDSIHDTVTNNTRLTVPSGVTKIRLSGQVSITLGTSTDWAQLKIRKNGTTFPLGTPSLFWELGSATQRITATSAVISVTAADYFELMLQTESDTSITLEASQTWFAMEIIE